MKETAGFPLHCSQGKLSISVASTAALKCTLLPCICAVCKHTATLLHLLESLNKTSCVLIEMITVIGTFRYTKIPKSKPSFHDLCKFEWDNISLMPDVENAWDYFYTCFSTSVNKHAPLKKYGVSGQNNAWFTPIFSSMLHELCLGKSEEK